MKAARIADPPPALVADDSVLKSAEAKLARGVISQAEYGDIVRKHGTHQREQRQAAAAEAAHLAAEAAQAAADEADRREAARVVAALARPQRLVCRLYVLAARHLVPMDADGTSDPYLRVRLGGRTVHGGRRDYVESANEREWYECVQFGVRLPGEAKVRAEVWDRDSDFSLFGDDLMTSEGGRCHSEQRLWAS